MSKIYFPKKLCKKKIAKFFESLLSLHVLSLLLQGLQDEPIMTGWPHHGQETISCNVLLFVSGISRAMDWGQHNWVWDKALVSQLKVSKFHQDPNPPLKVIIRPGHGILSRYWNSHFTRTMIRHPHHDNKKWVGLGQWILVLYYLSRSIQCPHPVQSLGWSCK